MAGYEKNQFKYSNSLPIVAIDDLNERAANKYSEEEQELRKKLAAVYRLVDLYGWSEGIYNHITCRVPGTKDHFLINPFGFFFHEVTASSLLKVDVDGTIVDPGSTNFGLNNRGFTLHSAVHMNRPDAGCVVHLHVPDVIAVSATKEGLLPVSQEACFVGPVSEYGFRGILTDLSERESIVEALGKNNAMLLRNHGFVICGDTIEQAFLRTFFFIYNVKFKQNWPTVERKI